jgi:2-polyprenyl-3-methyl-5-hydroxy-6-metoxy-1,4-benzoquinol methylase
MSICWNDYGGLLLQVTWNDAFRHSERLNPLSSETVLLAGKLAEFKPGNILLDLGSGKGFPSLLWASTFGIQVEGFDFSCQDVNHANSQAKLLNLGYLVKFTCRNVRQLKPSHKYDVVACLGIGLAEVYGSIITALNTFRQMTKSAGFLVLAEPVWLKEPVPERVQKELGVPEANLCTEAEMNRMLEDCGYAVLKTFVSTKEDWEFYLKPIETALHELAHTQPKLSTECQTMMQGFQAWYQAAEIHWNMLLWVARTRS